MSKKSYIVAFSKIASAILALALICGLTPIANAAGDNTADQSSIVTLDTPVQSEEDPPATQEESSTPAASGSSSATQEESSSSSSSSSSSGIQEESSTPTASDSDDVEIALQSEAAYTVASFVGYKDMFTALAKTKINGDKKTNQAALKLPTKLWVKLDAASLTAYKTDHAAEYAASETARTAHNDALSEGTPAEPTASDPYSNVTIPEDAVQVSVTTWTCRDDYEATDYELYTFDPTLDADFAPAEGVDLPFLEVEVGEVKAGARLTVSESDWINAARTWIKGTHTSDTAWDAYMGEQYFKSMGYDADGMNWSSLKWRSDVTAGIPSWDGTVADVANTGQIEPQTNPKMIPYYDSVTQTFDVWSANQLLYALYWVRDNAAANDSTGYSIHILGDIDFNGDNGVLWPADVSLTANKNTLLLLDGQKDDGSAAKLFNLFMWRQTDAEAIASGRPTGDGGGPTGLIGSTEGGALKAEYLSFKGANIMGNGYEGKDSPYNGTSVLLGFDANYGGNASFEGGYEHVSFDDCLIAARASYAAPLVGRDQGTNGKIGIKTMVMRDCNSQTTHVIGGYHCGGLAGSITNINETDRCFAVDTTVVTYGGHSGGLFACIANCNAVTRCFADANVYSLKEAGVFAGSVGGCHIYNSFTSGFVEGTQTLGGFVGILGSGSTQSMVNCYSTALVGLSSAGQDVGGFIGQITNASGYNTGFVNCYAAGEVGSAKTDSDSAGPSRSDNVGGFAGKADGLINANGTSYGRNIAAFCFYDKQTTAMREWDQGRYKGAYETFTFGQNQLDGTSNGINPSILQGYFKVGDPGIIGALTTDVTKQGVGYTGLTGDPTTATAGFTGFKDMTDYYAKSAGSGATQKTPITTFANIGWDYSAEGHYPELDCFMSASAADWDAEDLDLVKAYSKSSTSTAKLETWEKGLKASNGQIDGSTLPATTYDTVRDITTRFDLTSSGGEKWFTTATQDGADNDRATTTIQGQTRNVMDLLNDGTWYGDSFSPGMEWLRVGTTVDGVVASRRLRVTPTAGLEAGASQNRYQTTTGDDEFYDHADDVLFFYTTSARWATNEADVTTGVYPDTSPTGTAVPPTGVGGITREPDPITDDQRLYANGAANSLFDTFFGTGGGNGQNDLYGTDGTDTATGLDMSYMSRGYQTAIDGTLGDNSANGSHVYTYIRPISNFDPVTGKVSAGDLLETWDDEVYADRFNGYQKFDSENSQYLIEYVWELEDGRLIRDAKIFTVKAVPFDATIAAYESGGINASAAGDESLADTDDVFVGIDCDVTDIDNYDFATQTSERKTDTTHPDFGSHVVASWKNTNGLKSQTRLKVEFVFDPSGAGADKQYFSAILENPKVGDTIDIPYTFWRIITLENGEYYSIPQTLNRVYTVKQDAATGCMYLYFDKQDEKDPNGAYPELTMTDMEDTLNVSVELSSGLVLHKDTNADTTSGSGDYSDLTKQFTYNLYFNDGLVDAEDNPTPGTYSYNIYNDNGTPDDYSDDTLAPSTTARPNSGIFVSGTNLSTPVATTSADGGTAQTVALSDNEYVSILGAKAGYSYRFEELDYKDANGADAQVAKYTPAYAIDTGDTTSATGLAVVNSTWNEYESVVAKTSGRDTEAQTLPAYAEKTVEGAVVDNTISRTNVINTFKEVIPSGVSSEAQWPWLLILVAVVLMTLGGGYALYRKHNRGIKPQKMVASHSRGAALLR